MIAFLLRCRSYWANLVDPPASIEEVERQVEAGALPTLSFLSMLTCSSAIATLGLLGNSAAVIIGAMIIAPLMTPILSLAFGIVEANWKLSAQSLLTIVAGTLITLGLSYTITEAIGWSIGGSEIAARTQPSLLDMGVAVAAGAAAAYALTRPNVSSALAGVAIAVALVPPLCTAGVALSLGDDALTASGMTLGTLHARGPFLLFLTNIIGIILAAGVVFFVHYKKRPVLSLIALGAVSAGLLFIVPPLRLGMEHLLIRNQVRRSLALHDLLPAGARLRSANVRVELQQGVVLVSGDIVAEETLISQDLIDRSRDKLSEMIGRPVLLEYALIPETVVRSSPDDVNLPQEPITPPQGAE